MEQVTPFAPSNNDEDGDDIWDEASYGEGSSFSGGFSVDGDDALAQFANNTSTPLLGPDSGQDIGAILRKGTPWDYVRKKLLYLQKPNQPLLCREEEHQTIKEMLISMLQPIDDAGNILGGVAFIAGVPGTGKTATLRIVASQLRTFFNKEKKPRFSGTNASKYKFSFLEVNALKLSSPKMIYSNLWWVINNRLRQKHFSEALKVAKLGTLGISAAQSMLDDFFRGNLDESLRQEKIERDPILLLVDEIETLMTADQQILYTLFEWTRLPSAKLVIVGIANMLDLADRVHQKINSRIGTNRIIFNPYQPSQLLEILLSKLKNDMIFFKSEDVLEYIAKKVGASKGDARLTFEICSRSLRFAELRSIAQDPTGNTILPVDDKIVDQVIFSMRDNARLIALQALSLHDKIWILAVLFEIGSRKQWREQVTDAQRRIISKDALRKLDDDVTYFNMVNLRYNSFCKLLTLRPQPTTNLQACSQRILQLGVFHSNWDDRTLQAAIYPKMDPEDILKCIETEEKLATLFHTYNFHEMFGIYP